MYVKLKDLCGFKMKTEELKKEIIEDFFVKCQDGKNKISWNINQEGSVDITGSIVVSNVRFFPFPIGRVFGSMGICNFNLFENLINFPKRVESLFVFQTVIKYSEEDIRKICQIDRNFTNYDKL